MLRLAVYEIFVVKCQNLGFGDSPGYHPKGEKICPGPRCTIMQNFTPIGANVVEISVTGQRKNNQYTLPLLPMMGKNINSLRSLPSIKSRQNIASTTTAKANSKPKG